MKLLITALFVVFCLITCDSSQQFLQLGERLASPIDVAVADTGTHFYVINADHDRTYNQGSILVIDEAGNKLRAVSTPRMASSVDVAGEHMLVTFMQSTEFDQPEVHRYSLQNPDTPELDQRWELPCQPLHSVQRTGYRYFFVSCVDGTLLYGDHDTNTLRPVRKYQYPRRAMYLDAERELLLAFPTSLDRPAAEDRRLKDVESADKKDGGGNFIPDEWETRAANASITELYQFALYDIKAAEQAQFPFSDTAASEMHWLTYDDIATSDKYYRTNFWQAAPDPDDTSIFYLSQRGNLPTKTHTANNVVKVSIAADLRANANHALTFAPAATSPHKLWYPSDLAIQHLDKIGKVLFIGSLRDVANWPSDKSYSSILIHAPTWQEHVQGKAIELGAFAVNARGVLLAVAFFSNQLRMFKLSHANEALEEIELE